MVGRCEHIVITSVGENECTVAFSAEYGVIARMLDRRKIPGWIKVRMAVDTHRAGPLELLAGGSVAERSTER